MNSDESTLKINSSPTPESTKDMFSKRSLNQFGLFVAGAGLFAFSMAYTRRSITRRYQNYIPKFFNPSNHASTEVNGAMEALVALNLATINVCSAGIMTAGVILWALDISSTDDLKLKAQRNLVNEKTLREAENSDEIESWIASLLSRKEFRALREENKITEEILQAKIKSNQKKEGELNKTDVSN